MTYLRVALMVPLLASCASGLNPFPHRLKEENNTFFAANTYVSEGSGGLCSFEQRTAPTSGAQEALAAAILAPIAISLAKQGVSAIGKALANAGSEREKTTVSSAGGGFFASLGFDQQGNSPTVTRSGFCVRTLIAEFEIIAPVANQVQSIENENGANAGAQGEGGTSGEDQGTTTMTGPEGATTPDDQNGSESDDGSSLTTPANAADFRDPAKIKSAILATLQANNHAAQGAKIKRVFFYAEHQVERFTKGAGQEYYQISPQIIWYNESHHGKRYKLASITLNFNPVPAGDDGPVLQYVQSFPPTGLKAGTLQTAQTVSFADAKYFSVPPLSTKETEFVASLTSLLTARSTAVDTEELRLINELSAEQERDAARFKCLAAAKDDENKTAECEKRKEISIVNEEELAKKFDHNQRTLEAKIEALKGKFTGQEVGAFNVHSSINESRAADQFLSAVGKAFADTESDRDEAISSFIKKKTGLTDTSAQDMTNDGQYRLALFEYDIALRDYNDAVAKGDQDDIDTKLRNLITKYNDLASKALSVGKAPPAAPY